MYTPQEILVALNRAFPQVWRCVDKIRAERTPKDTWPDYIFLPAQKWQDIVRDELKQDEYSSVTHCLITVGAWRCTQDIVKFDPDFYDALAATDNATTIKIYKDILCRLPAWCIYFSLPEGASKTLDLKGFYGLLDCDASIEYLKLYFVRSNGVMHAISLGFDADNTINLDMQKFNSEMKEAIPIALNIILYVCSYGLPHKPSTSGGGLNRPTPKKIKGGWRLFPPDKTTEHMLGADIGESIRNATRDPSTRTDVGTHAGPRPHIRRAHWHGYWHGTIKEREGKETIPRRFELKWLPPLPVALREDINA